MTETSKFWDGTSLGDAAVAPYDAPTEFAEVLIDVSQARLLPGWSGIFKADPDSGLNSDNNFGITLSGAGVSPVYIASGRALVYGTWYVSDANVAFTVPTPVSQQRVDRIVLRKDWATQTVRLTRLAGVEGGSGPGVTRTIGDKWDMQMFELAIQPTTGVITVGDERQYIGPLLALGTGATEAAAGNHTHSLYQIGGAAVTLPAPVAGLLYYAKAWGQTLTVNAYAGSSIYSDAQVSSLAIPSGDAYTFLSDGSNWWVV